jgi:hypothetical protein
MVNFKSLVRWCNELKLFFVNLQKIENLFLLNLFNQQNGVQIKLSHQAIRGYEGSAVSLGPPAPARAYGRD